LYNHPKVIKTRNFVNKQVNKVVNNPLSNWLKEVAYQVGGVPYPEFLCHKSDDEYEYLRLFVKDYPTKNLVLRWIRLLLRKELFEVRVQLTSSSEFAMDVSKLWLWKKIQLKNYVNKFFRGDKVFRFRRILTYK
jgi:hypothetical protein